MLRLDLNEAALLQVTAMTIKTCVNPAKSERLSARALPVLSKQDGWTVHIPGRTPG
jgi:hypothetical protein